MTDTSIIIENSIAHSNIDEDILILNDQLDRLLDDNYFDFNKFFRKNKLKKKSCDFASFEKVEKESPENNYFILLEETKKDNIFTVDEWNRIIKNNSLNGIDTEKLIKSLRAGIPNNLRGRIWKLLSNTKNNDDSIFFKLLEKKNDEDEYLIRKDLDRTNINLENKDHNNSIEVKEKLFNILKAYASYDNQVGYCQGMNFIVSILLSNIVSQTDTFWVFVNLMHDKNLRLYFVNNTPKLIKALEKLSYQIKLKLPDLYDHFEKENFLDNIPGVFSHFFTTIFTYNMPIDFSNRILDLFWIFDEKFLIDTIIHLLRMKRQKLKRMNMEELCPYLKQELVKDCIREFSIEKTLPLSYYLLEEVEVSID